MLIHIVLPSKGTEPDVTEFQDHITKELAKCFAEDHPTVTFQQGGKGEYAVVSVDGSADSEDAEHAQFIFDDSAFDYHFKRGEVRPFTPEEREEFMAVADAHVAFNDLNLD